MIKPLNVTMIDDDKNFMQIMSMRLSSDFKMNTFHDPENALQFLKQNGMDAVLLDLHMNEYDGFEVCQRIKNIQVNVPVFFLTSDDEPRNISKSFKFGSIDYFFKSMDPDELISRVQGRVNSLSVKPKNPNLLTCREIVIDAAARRVWITGKEVIFSPKEFDILKLFMEHQDEALSKSVIHSMLWTDVTVNLNNIDTHMYHIRKKFEGLATGIECKKGAGYILRSDA